MKRGKCKVAGFSHRESGFNSLKVTHLTDEDDVGVLTQNIF